MIDDMAGRIGGKLNGYSNKVNRTCDIENKGGINFDEGADIFRKIAILSKKMAINFRKTAIILKKPTFYRNIS